MTHISSLSALAFLSLAVGGCGDSAASLSGPAERYNKACVSNMTDLLNGLTTDGMETKTQQAIRSSERQCLCEAKGLPVVLTEAQLGKLTEAHEANGLGYMGVLAAADTFPLSAKQAVVNILEQCR